MEEESKKFHDYEDHSYESQRKEFRDSNKISPEEDVAEDTRGLEKKNEEEELTALDSQFLGSETGLRNHHRLQSIIVDSKRSNKEGKKNKKKSRRGKKKDTKKRTVIDHLPKKIQKVKIHLPN